MMPFVKGLQSISWILALSILVFIFGCRQGTTSSNKNDIYTLVQGQTMGTYYQVTSLCSKSTAKVLKYSIDSLLIDINQAVSTYIPSSFISEVNTARDSISIENSPIHFDVNLAHASKYFRLSDGYLDVSVLPLINYWGFGYTPKVPVNNIDSIKVNDLMRVIGLKKWRVTDKSIVKKSADQQLDFSSIAKGYAVDEVGRLLLSFGCKDFLVDIGGEQLARGKSHRGDYWSVGINTPDPEARLDEAILYLKLNDKAIATSGNYRIFHEVNGQKYGHTINPKSGYPFQDELLSVSIIADNCIDADAISTACMAMGYRKAITFIETMPDISACFLIGASDGTIQSKFANGFIRYIFKPEFQSNGGI